MRMIFRKKPPGIPEKISTLFGMPPCAMRTLALLAFMDVVAGLSSMRSQHIVMPHRIASASPAAARTSTPCCGIDPPEMQDAEQQQASQGGRREYSTLVKITAENRAPLRQARIFFLYPSTIAGASIASYVALTRLIAGLSGMRTDLTPLSDAGNLFIDVAVVAAAVWFLRSDLKAREEQLELIAAELQEGEN